MKNSSKVLILLIVLFFIGVACYRYLTYTYVTAEFKNLRPFHAKAPIYYNGFEIGRVVKVAPNEDYTSTIVTLRLHPRDLKLPVNISANLKKEKNKNNDKFDYIDLIYPPDPSVYFLKNGDRISGKATVELESYLSNQDPESLDAIKADFADAIKNLNITIQTLGDLFETINSMAEGVQPDVIKAAGNLRKSSENLTNITYNIDSFTGNIDNSLNEEKLNTTTNNLEEFSGNLNTMAGEINRSIPDLHCTVKEVNRILCNVDELSSGINNTLKKQFGGLRLFFGRPISKK